MRVLIFIVSGKKKIPELNGSRRLPNLFCSSFLFMNAILDIYCRSIILIICYILVFITIDSYLHFVVFSRIMSTRHKRIHSLFNKI